MLDEIEYEEEEEDEEEEEEDESQEEEEERDEDIIDKTWRPAGYEDVEKLRPLAKPRRVQIIINRKEKVYAEIFLKDLSVGEQLTIEESLLSVEQRRKGKRRRKAQSKQKMSINLKEYYRLCWEQSVVRTNPPHLKKWKEIQRFKGKSRIWAKIKDLLPDPYSSDEDEDENPN